jgi:hypothetical protein
VFDDCYEGYVYDAEQIRRNEMFTGGKSDAIGVEGAAAANGKELKSLKSSMELELAEAKSMMKSELTRANRKHAEEMQEMREMLSQMLNGGSPTLSSPKGRRFHATQSGRFDASASTSDFKLSDSRNYDMSDL